MEAVQTGRVKDGVKEGVTCRDNELGIFNPTRAKLVNAGVKNYGELHRERKSALFDLTRAKLVNAGIKNYGELIREKKMAIFYTNDKRLVKAGVSKFGEYCVVTGTGAPAMRQAQSKILHETMIVHL